MFHLVPPSLHEKSTLALFAKVLFYEYHYSFCGYLYSVPIFKKVLPIGIFLVENLSFLFGKIMRVIRKKIIYFFLVKGKPKFANNIGIVDPPNQIAFILFIKII